VPELTTLHSTSFAQETSTSRPHAATIRGSDAPGAEPSGAVELGPTPGLQPSEDTIGAGPAETHTGKPILAPQTKPEAQPSPQGCPSLASTNVPHVPVLQKVVAPLHSGLELHEPPTGTLP
jgi:hypothetical protein